MTIKKRELEKFLRLHRYNTVYIRHISDILRKKHIYEDHALQIQETGKYYKIKWL